MHRIWIAAAIWAVSLTTLAFAADKDCTLKIPESGCKCEKCIECTKTDNCGNCQDIPFKQDDCIGIPVADEPCRVIDPNCCGSSSFCLLDASRGQYTMCCPGGCYELLNKCQKDLCPECKETKCNCEQKCGCEKKQCGCKKQECGCKKQECGCKSKCGCEKKQKDCGCKSKCGCESKCGGGCGSVECGCYMPYEAPAPRQQPGMLVPQQPMYVPLHVEPEIVIEEPEVIKVEGRG